MCIDQKSAEEKAREKEGIPCGHTKLRSNMGREEVQERGLKKEQSRAQEGTKKSFSVNLRSNES